MYVDCRHHVHRIWHQFHTAAELDVLADADLSERVRARDLGPNARAVVSLVGMTHPVVPEPAHTVTPTRPSQYVTHT